MMGSQYRGPSRSEREANLLKKWKEIEALDDDENNVSEQEFARCKEIWFGQAFSFLRDLPQEEHCWCGHSDIVWPLLEPFYCYFTVSENNAYVKILWKRFSLELGKCTQCVLQYYKAKEMYATDFLEEVVSTLLAVLQTLDEERVATHLHEILYKMRNNSLNSERDSEELICVLFEVMRFPMLLDDAEIDSAFVPFLQYVENTYELTLAADQCYPGVYALLFHTDQATRGVALRLAAAFGKLRTAANLEPIQPLLQKHMNCLEFDLFDQRKFSSGKGTSGKNAKLTQESLLSLTVAKSRPRACFTRESLWMGLKTLLGMLEPPAFEEGVIERYPSFLSIVLNHASEATPVFWNALHCLKLLLEVLGYKLWIKTTFSPGVMRSTLIGQCFHTREEKMHKAIFDLFQPFLQSLEALQDGEYERQRRNILYFLLQQVSHSRNFSGLMSKKARQIAFIIVMRGFKMDPACPPLECVHVWGPPLLESVRDTQLYDSVRLPAVCLLETIIIADSAVLACLHSRGLEIKSTSSDCLEIDEEVYDDLSKFFETGAIESSHFREYKPLDKLAEERGNWLCAPILWVDVLGKVLPADLPESFSQAVVWAVSRLCTVNYSNQLSSGEVPPDKYPEVTSSKAIASSLIWETPKGCDDGADGKLCPNTLKAWCHGSQLVFLLKRCADTFVGHLQKSRVVERWIWDPFFAEALVLLSLDSNEKMRDFGRYVLSHFARDSSLDVGLTFLCSSSQASAAYVNSGLFYATKLLMMNRLHEAVLSLQNLLFFAWKVVTLWQRGSQRVSQSPDALNDSSFFGKEGGFLKQPNYDQPLKKDSISVCEERSWEKATKMQQLSCFLWPLLLKLMKDGRPYSEDGAYLMLFTRLFDLLPSIFQNILPSLAKAFSTKGILQSSFEDSQELHAANRIAWIFHFISWGEVCTASIHRRWKAALVSILSHLRDSNCLREANLLKEVQDWLESGAALNDQMRDRVETLLRWTLSGANESVKSFDLEIKPSSDAVADMDGEDDALCMKDSGVAKAALEDQDVIVLSDDEDEYPPEYPPEDEIVCVPEPLMNVSSVSRTLDNTVIGKASTELESSDSLSKLHEAEVPFSQTRRHMHPVSMQKQLGIFASGHGKNATLDKYFGSSKDKPTEHSQAENKSVPSSSNVNVLKSKCSFIQREKEKGVVGAEKRIIPSKSNERVPAQVEEKSDQYSFIGEETDQTNAKKKYDLEGSLNAVLKELVQDESDDVFKTNVIPAKSLQTVQKKGLGLAPFPQPRRQLIQLQVPNEHLRGNSRKPGVATRPPPPRLDEWYKRILSLDYFFVVGLSSDTSAEGLQAEPMLKVPSAFRSSQHYMDVFRPLVLEEFKAQLQQTYDQLTLSDGMTTGILRLMSLEKVDDFEVGRFTAEAGADGPARACFENDLLLLSRQPFKDGAQAVHMIGKVERQERDNKCRSVKLVLKFFLRSGSKRLAKARSLLLERSKWHTTRLMSITPQLREFQALSAVGNLPLLPIILNNESCKMGSPSIPYPNKQALQGLSDKLQRQLRTDYNASQLQSIEVALTAVRANGQELSLVQGPPGTGKTRTIVAIVSALIASIKSSKGHIVSTKGDNAFGTTHVNANRSVSKSVAIARSWQAAALAKEQQQQEALEDMQRERDKQARILVCAQSNAAVDELVSRICKDGLYGLNGGFFKPYLVRVGNAKTVHPNCLPVFIDTLVENRMESDKENSHAGGVGAGKKNAELLRGKLEKILESIQVLEAQLSKLQNSDAKEKKSLAHDTTTATADAEAAIKTKVNILYKQRRQICGELAVVEAGEKRSLEEGRSKRQLLKRDIIRQAEVVVATLSGCGGDVYSACVEKSGGRRHMKNLDDGFFDAVVIDEAAQALEPATLIPLQLLKSSHAKCIMVGDPKQLPATVISQMASRFSYECSMFERLQRGGHRVSVLSVQYRMHPEIREFPSAHFYDNQLQDGASMTDRRKAVFHENTLSGPYVVFDVVEGYERVKRQSSSQSLCNEAEVDVALEIFRNLKTRYPAEVSPGRIGVITPYQQQLSLLRERFTRLLGQSVAEGIEFNTVDGFQGREVDILILSTVRATTRNAQSSSRIGFVADVRRMNVALTRARFSLWVVCNASTLQASPPWAALLQNAKERGVLHAVKSPYRYLFDDCHSNESKEKIGNSQRRSPPVGPGLCMSQLDKVPGKRQETGKEIAIQKSVSVGKPYKCSNRVEDVSTNFVLNASKGDYKNECKDKVECGDSKITDSLQEKDSPLKLDISCAKKESSSGEDMRDIGQSDVCGCCEAGKNLLQAVSSNQICKNIQNDRQCPVSYDAGRKSLQPVSIDQICKQSRGDMQCDRYLKRVDCRESGRVSEGNKKHNQNSNSVRGKNQLSDRSQSETKSRDNCMTETMDTQLQATKGVEQLQFRESISMLKDTYSKGSSVSKSKGSHSPSSTGFASDKMDSGMRVSPATHPCIMGASQPFTSDVGMKSSSTGRGVAGDEIISSPLACHSCPNDVDSELKILRPSKRQRQEKAAGLAFPTEPLNTQTPLPRHVPGNALKDHTAHHQKAKSKGFHHSHASEDHLNGEWERFQRVLAETKILFPLATKPRDEASCGISTKEGP